MKELKQENSEENDLQAIKLMQEKLDKKLKNTKN